MGKGEFFYGFREGDSLVLGEEGEGISRGATPEAVVESFFVIDVEGGCFFLMEGAESRV